MPVRCLGAALPPPPTTPTPSVFLLARTSNTTISPPSPAPPPSPSPPSANAAFSLSTLSPSSLSSFNFSSSLAFLIRSCSSFPSISTLHSTWGLFGRLLNGLNPSSCAFLMEQGGSERAKRIENNVSLVVARTYFSSSPQSSRRERTTSRTPTNVEPAVCLVWSIVIFLIEGSLASLTHLLGGFLHEVKVGVLVRLVRPVVDATPTDVVLRRAKRGAFSTKV